MNIPERVVAELLAHAREEAPRECCGLLVGTPDSVVRSVRARNLAEERTRYLVDPHDHFRAIRAARADRLEVVGAYHSHPATAPVPSPTDVNEAANGSDFLYVIVSLLNDDVRAYRIDGGAAVACTVQRTP